MAKKYDPLWELVGEKVPLEGAEPDIDALCPNCHVRVHVGHEAQPGEQVECGLCGAALKIIQTPEGLGLDLNNG